MPPETTQNMTEPQTTTTATAQPVSTPEAKPQEDIVSRVAAFKETDTSGSKPAEPISFDASSFDKITTVEDAKKYAQSAYQSFEKGYQKKFQDIAELRKTLEGMIKNQTPSWTTDKVASLLKEPSFIAAANDVLKLNGQQPEDQFSALSESEKRRIAEIEQNNRMLIQRQNDLLLKQEDEQLKSRYPNYNPQAVDTITADLLANKITNTREYIWKASDYESAVKRAYQLGRQDERVKLNENNQSASYTGINTGTPSATMSKEKNESNENFLRRLYSHAVTSIAKPA